MVTARGGADGDGPVERSLFEFEVCFQINPCGGNVFVAEPQRDDGGVDPGVQQSHGGGVPQEVGCDVLVREGGARRCRSGNVNGHALSDGVEAERATPVGWEQRILAVADSFGHPVAQHRCRGGGERGDAVFAALASAADMCGGVEVDVVAGQRDQLGCAQSGLDRERQEGVVASPAASGPVGRVEQGLCLDVGEVGDHGVVAAFGGDREHPADVVGVLGVTQRGLSAVDDYPQWTGRRIRIRLQGRRLPL
jgi:hypothetical protein